MAPHEERLKENSFWSTSIGVLLQLVLVRLPILFTLFFLIIFTHTPYWQSNTTATVFMQQTLTAAVGLLVALLLRDCAWMVQGAIAAAWSFRKKGMPLPFSEAIQFGHPALIFHTSAGWIDKATVLMIPILCALLSVIYKFGITVREADQPWKGVVRTNLLSYFLDQRPIFLEKCVDEYAACKSKYLDEFFAINKDSSPDLDDYSFMDGVDVGRQISSTAYRLDIGDVPSVNADYRTSVRGGISYTQFYIQSNIDCGRNASTPWDLGCSSVIGPERLPPRDSSGDDVQNFTLCAPFENSRMRGVITFKNDSLDLSCLFNLTFSLRNVSASTDRFTWKVIPTGPALPFPTQNLWNARVKFTHFVPIVLNSWIDNMSGDVCYGQGRVCKGLSKAYQLEIGSHLITVFSGWAYQFLQWARDPLPKDEEDILPIPGRVMLQNPSPWVKVIGPVSTLNMTTRSNSTVIVGVTASANILVTTFVTVEYWLFAFSVLVVIQVCAAAIKIYFRCHPLESVGGLVWTLRKVAPDVAEDVHGLKLSELLDVTCSLMLERSDDAVISIKRRTSGKEKRVSVSQTLGFEPVIVNKEGRMRPHSGFASQSFGGVGQMYVNKEGRTRPHSIFASQSLGGYGLNSKATTESRGGDMMDAVSHMPRRLSMHTRSRSSWHPGTGSTFALTPVDTISVGEASSSRAVLGGIPTSSFVDDQALTSTQHDQDGFLVSESVLEKGEDYRVGQHGKLMSPVPTVL